MMARAAWAAILLSGITVGGELPAIDAAIRQPDQIHLALTGPPQSIGGAPQREREVVPRIDPFCRVFDSSSCEAISKAAAFFGTLLVFFLLFLLTRSKR